MKRKRLWMMIASDTIFGILLAICGLEIILIIIGLCLNVVI